MGAANAAILQRLHGMHDPRGIHQRLPASGRFSMKTRSKRYELTPYALTLIHRKARRLVGKAGFHSGDLGDIKQELIVGLLERLPKFDPAKAAYNTFVSRVVDRKIANMLRDRRAEVRDHRREVCSLNDEIDTGEDDPIQRLSLMSQDDLDLRADRRTDEQCAHLRIDVQTMLTELPPPLRRAAKLLQTLSITDVARKMEIPHATFYDNHLVHLREAFADKGFECCL